MTDATPEHDPVLAFTGGDRVEAEQLRRSLEAIRDHLGDERVTGRIEAVLAGRGSMRELTRDPAFLGELGKGMDAFSAQWARMSPGERAELARQGQESTDIMREAMGMPPEADPAPIGEFGPALTDPE
ncbi:MAG: hypothetical protein JWO76_2568 [Nocardioides sp.]|nr:hypothetical protein [Nocardioides sp.]